MPRLSPDLSRRLREALTCCGPFDSDRALRAVFVDARIAPWRDLISDNTPSRAARVDALIEALLEQVNDASDSALALFLDVLVGRTASGDVCKQRLARLAAELRELPPSPTEAKIAPSGPALQGGKYEIHIHGGQVGAIGDNAHIKGGIHFGGVQPVAASDPAAALNRARRALTILEEQVAGFGALHVPVHLQIELEEKRREVAALEFSYGDRSSEQDKVEYPASSAGNSGTFHETPKTESVSDNSASALEKSDTTPQEGFLRQRLGSARDDLELYPLNCGDRGITLGEQRLLVSSAFGTYFTGLLERDYNYVSLPGQIDCPVMAKSQTLTGIQRVFWALQYPKGPRILIIAAEGGMGKSTLAAKIVRCMMDEEASDMILGDSAKTQQINPITGEVQSLEPSYYDVKTFYARLANQLGLPRKYSQSSVLSAIKDRLVGRRAVIVVDNLETVHKGDELLRSLHAIVNRDVRAIITTRKIEGLRNLTVESLVVHLKPLTSFEAICDFLRWHIQRYAAEYRELELLRSDLDSQKQVMWLMERTGGIPLLLQLIASDVARFSWEYLRNLPQLFGSELLAYLYKTRWQELDNEGVEGKVACSILRQIVDCQYMGITVTLKYLSEWLESRNALEHLQPALTLLHTRFMIVNQDPQQGNLTVVPSLSEFIRSIASNTGE